jgi:hypothetical protein
VGEGRRRRAWIADHPHRPVDVIVSHAEVNDRHGTGVLTQRLFGGAADVASVRSHDDYDARQGFGAWSVRIAQPDGARTAVARRVRAVFRGIPVRRIVAIPFHPDDVWNALALQDLSSAPLCTYVMDDRNVASAGIPDGLLSELLSRSRLRLAVSEEIRDAYSRKFRLPFAYVPPVIDPDLVLRAPSLPPRDALEGRRGAMIGNVWGRAWLARLCQVVREAGIELDWYSSGGLGWHALGVDDLRRAGIRWHPGPPDAELVALLRRAAFAVLPTGTLDESDDHAAIARMSLPSKLVYTTAAAHLPAIVIGHPDTAAARFVARMDIGVVVPYQGPAFAAAVGRIVRPEVQAMLRARAADLAPAFSAEGAGDWIWRSLAEGRPVDDRWERLAAAEARAEG